MSCACIDKDGIKLTVNSNLQESIVTVRDELLKQGDLYDGFVASIFSVLKPKEHYVGDGESEIRDIASFVGFSVMIFLFLASAGLIWWR